MSTHTHKSKHVKGKGMPVGQTGIQSRRMIRTVQAAVLLILGVLFIAGVIFVFVS